MADYRQVTTIGQRLAGAITMLNPLRLGSVARAVLRELGTPPPGDPAQLRAMAESFRRAAGMLRPVVAEIRALDPSRRPDPSQHPGSSQRPGSSLPPGEWHGVVATSTDQVATATVATLPAAPPAWLAAAEVLDRLAGAIDELRRRHDHLRRELQRAVRDSTHVRNRRLPNPTALHDLARATIRMIRGCAEVHTEATAAADEAARRFADLAGRARVASAVAGGLPAADAVVLAGWAARTGGTGDGGPDGALSGAQLAAVGRRLTGAEHAEDAEHAETAEHAEDAEHAAVGRRLTGAEHVGAGRPVVRDEATVRAALARAGSDTERAYLLKAYAAGHSGAELAAFADAIRGRDDDWLRRHLTLIDRDRPGEQRRFGVRIDQCDRYTCGTTAIVVARAELDPRYALSLTGGDPDGFDGRLTAEQHRVHDITNRIYPQWLGTTPKGVADWLTEWSGTRYRWRLVDDTDRRAATAALRDVVTAVHAGYPVPILVGGVTPRHYVLAVGHSADGLLVFEPTRGAIVRVPAEDFVAGRLRPHAGFDHVQLVVLPSEAAPLSGMPRSPRPSAAAAPGL